jgi:hypothetical protein
MSLTEQQMDFKRKFDTAVGRYKAIRDGIAGGMGGGRFGRGEWARLQCWHLLNFIGVSHIDTQYLSHPSGITVDEIVGYCEVYAQR